MNWRALATVASIDPSPAELRWAVEQLRDLPPEGVVAGIATWRVDELALENLRSADAGDVVNRLEDMWIAEEHRLAKAIPVTVEVLSAVQEMSGRVIKGLAVRDGYPRPELRHMGDIDVQVSDWSTALRISRWLRERQWCWDTSEYPWLKWDDHGDIYGQMTFVLPDNVEPFARIDLHIGPFSVGHAGLLPMVGWRPGRALDVPVTVPDIETSIALITAHAVGDGLLSMKDVNDLHVLLTEANPDWTSVVELCRGASVTEALYVLLAAVREVYPAQRFPQSLADRRGPLSYGPSGSVLALTDESKQRRAERVVRLTYRDERTRGRGLIDALKEAAVAKRYYRTDLTPHVTHVPPGRATPGDPGRGRCWRLLPLETWRGLATADRRRVPVSTTEPTETELAVGLTLLTRESAMAVRIDDDVMVPTVWGSVDPQSIDLASGLAER